MNWYNTITDKLPTDNRQVLISVNGVYYTGVFMLGDRAFRVMEDSEILYFGIDHNQIYWAEVNGIRNARH